jgi:hypothetical protein
MRFDSGIALNIRCGFVTGVGIIVKTEVFDSNVEEGPLITIILSKARCALFGERNQEPSITAVGAPRNAFLRLLQLPIPTK